MYAYSTNEGSTWSKPIQIPTPGLANNAFAWAAAGDDGRVDIAWYGTAASVDPAGGPQQCPNGGPDSVGGPWGLYFTQTCLGDACNDGDRQLRVFLDGQAYTGDPTLLPLTDQAALVITMGTTDQLPDPMPDSFTFGTQG